MTTIILDPHWRSMDELFSPKARAALDTYDVVWGQDDPIPDHVMQDALPQADILIAATPQITAQTLTNAPSLKAIIEVSGAFPDTIDYAACTERGVEVLSCSPGFRSAVAEMGLAMTLAATRGLIREHEAFRTKRERWLDDCAEADFTLFGAKLGFVGFGQIAQEMTRLLAPFRPEIAIYDPMLPAEVAASFGVTQRTLTDLAAWSDVFYVTAVPTADNAGLIDAKVLSAVRDQKVVVALSRAHLVDFPTMVAEARSGRLTIATDVFPNEPIPDDDPLRQLPNVILSPHRAAAVAGGRHLIGDLIIQDITAIQSGRPNRGLLPFDPAKIDSLAGVGDATQVADMAAQRS